MSQFTRRTFLKACGATAVAHSLLHPTQAIAGNSTRYWLHGFNEQQFGEETLLRRAMDVLTTRLQSERVWDNVKRISGTSGYNVRNFILKNAQLAPNAHNAGLLLYHQLKCLSLPNGPGDTGPAIPHIHLRAFHERSNVLAKVKGGGYGSVTIKFLPDGTMRQSGSFEIWINRYNLAGGGLSSDPEQWAGTIGHEMLHNLGHLHAKGDYSDAWQINVLDNAIINNGYYRHPRYRWRKFGMVCGGNGLQKA